MLTIVAALHDEIRLIKSEMEIDSTIRMKPFAIYKGKYNNSKIALVRTGVGKENTKQALTYILDNLKPSTILNVGYAGGLDPHLHSGDIVIANFVIEEASESSWPVDQGLVENAKTVSESADLRLHVGKMVTVEKPLTGPHDKAFTGTRFEAIACEMESSIIAEAATKAKVPFLIVRSVIDPMDVEVPEIPEKAISDGKVKIGRLLGHLKGSPKDILKLPKFSYLANQARISLTNFIRTWVSNEQNR
jgi:adenosylhomocysteine nucleosidase